VTVGRVLIGGDEKRQAAGLGWIADMESLHIGRLAQAAGIPWCVMRGVSDSASDGLPLDFNKCLGEDGGVRTSLVLRELARRPGALPGLIRLGMATSRAAEALAQAADIYLPHWYRTVVGEEGIKQSIG
jgi:hypothetical protein